MGWFVGVCDSWNGSGGNGGGERIKKKKNQAPKFLFCNFTDSYVGIYISLAGILVDHAPAQSWRPLGGAGSMLDMDIKMNILHREDRRSKSTK